jgi:hypothetical protein
LIPSKDEVGVVKSWNIALLFALATTSAFACGGTAREGDSETHWVACKRTEDCSGAQLCEAKRCVEPATEGAGGRSSNLPTTGTGGGPTTGTGGGPTTGTGGGPTSGTGGGPTSGTGGGPTSGTGGGPTSGTGGQQSQDLAWGCIGQPSEPPSITEIPIDFVLQDDFSGAPLASGRAELCRSMDVGCQNPISSGIASDASGRLTLLVPSDLDGYAWFTFPSNLPTSFVLTRSTLSTAGETTVRFMNVEGLSTLGNLVDAPQLAGNGFAIVTIRDCTGATASDVSFEMSSLPSGQVGTSRPVYWVGGNLDTSANETDSTGLLCWTNAPVGAVTLYARVGSRDLGRIPFLVKADSVTVVNIAPRDLL